MDNGQNVVSDLLMFDLKSKDWTEFKQLRRKHSDIYQLDGNYSSPMRMDTNSSVENSPHRNTEQSELIRDPKNITKFTIDTQSTYERKKIVPNPAVR